MTKLPPWQAHNPRERRAMARWVNQVLDRADDKEMDDFMQAHYADVAALRENIGAADVIPRHHGERPAESFDREIELAERGNIEPLRKRLPHLAKFLHLAKRGVGQRYPKITAVERARANLGIDEVQEAVKDVRRIRALWKQCYGKQNRPRGDNLAAEIAAGRWAGVEVEDIIQRMKKSPAK